MTYDVYVGTYAAEGRNSIFHFEADCVRRTLLLRKCSDALDRPSWLLFTRPDILCAVEEKQPEGFVAALRVKGDRFDLLRRFSSYGADPCHLSLDEEHRFLFVSNYTSGSVAAFELDEDGVPFKLSSVHQHSGSSVHPIRQAGPHAHFSHMHDRRLYVCDLGQDRILLYALDHLKKALATSDVFISTPSGCGIRHLCFPSLHRDRMYGICELNGDLLYFEHKSDGWICRQQLQSMSTPADTYNLSGAIHMSDDEQYLFVSNRGMDLISAFSIGEDGYLHMVDCCSSGGHWPRDFAVLGDDLLVACQKDSCLTMIHFDRQNQKLLLNPERFDVEQPVCVIKARKGI